MAKTARSALLLFTGVALGVAGIVITGPRRLQNLSLSWVADRARSVPEPTREEAGVPANAEPPATEWVDDGWCAADKQANGSEPAAVSEQDQTCRRLLPVVRLSTALTARRIGLEFGTALRRRHAHRLAANAEIDYAAHDYAEVRPRVMGLIREVRADEGEKVRKGDVLVVIDSAEVGTAKAQYLTATAAAELANVNRTSAKVLVDERIVSAKKGIESQSALNQAKAELLNAKQRLRNLGLTDQDLTEISRREDTSSMLNVVAPIDGTLVERLAVIGVAVERTTLLFVDADISRMWAWIDVYETDIAQVAPGQAVTFTISGTDSPVFTGRVELIGAAVNPATRTIRVRAELANTDGKLRAKQFGQAEIQVGAEHETVVVPKEAVQSDGQNDLVFLSRPDGAFRPQRVKTRLMESPAEIEIEWGLVPGQRLVTTGAFLLKSEMFKAIFGDEILGGEG
ncbi:MAG TPA: efflux RND transporter periplasmic adaptor subunit [Isosphaeraceae bacterium]|nr:efflux RND transporter periplasmic adaptor subunit [Isosphaeraceae bacterium]